MKKHYIITVCLILVCSLASFIIGVKSIDVAKVEASLYSIFADDVVEVRQGRMAGAIIAASDNESLSESWEELTSDIIREFGSPSLK